MDIQTILNKLKKEGWFFDEDFIKNNEDMLQAIADKTLALQVQQGVVMQSVCVHDFISCGNKAVECVKCNGVFKIS